MNQEENNQEKERIDFSDMLKSSETKFKTEQEGSAYFFRPGMPKIVQWAIKHSGGLIKNEKQASYLILGFIAAMIAISLFLISRISSPKTVEPTGPIIEEAGSPTDITP